MARTNHKFPPSGSNVQQVLKLLEVLDTHSFLTSRSSNPLTTLYHRLAVAQRGSEHPLGDDMFAMLLCQWAVSAHRSGAHRPLVMARILRQRQDHVIRVRIWGVAEWVWSSYCSLN